MPKYRTATYYYPPEISLADWNIGRFINDLRNSGQTQAVLIKFVPRKEADHSHELGAGEEETYTDIQGNVGSS